MAQEIFITTADKVKEGEGFDFKYKGRPAILIRHGGGVKAFINICPHSGYETKMYEGKLECVEHFATFDPDTGMALTLPATPGSSLLEIKLKVADNKIYHLNTIVFKSKKL
ncbi:hypothetical protein A3C91_03430 [Candidatus Azambacteria bacterium RIFCSPHIGHO2_02_FULL_52_12]|uniref:Rieske domain-containing protein n=1 Tax=Candidatus Azambacteria bacterium RIFCSPLOWO2_01_FULL_46_25 TaxID=1797298 RepID=A0A1F5BW09_9BACT|nr:MAG: hypothetical protein A3C91_03430 [Candidatus Azambacteria bacterium RIFCSPHIGHO2_02_FULL_52_12]OGD34803.1 MAG: hypothetical protein A2988_04910 [Candidatus Azambacteria bacterium RIFCSPLOWO2_01_FULL_46_25]OGD37932.1 MAG: hypothetical protein A2850_04145 [Candidatus Azambacteria bacterium RIFCSPHIGHO2_01_FULL_51_74]